MNDTLIPNDVFSEKSGFLPLGDSYRKNGYEFKLEKRVGDVAIFGQYSDYKLIAYEVFEIRKQKEQEFNGIKYEAKERVPSNEEWGTNAYTVHKLEKAYEYLHLILKYIENRNIHVNTTQ